MRKILVGAPSLLGMGVAVSLAAQFPAEAFPMPVEIENRMPFPIIVTEAGSVSLGHVADLDNAKGCGEFQNIGQMVRCITSIEQLAEHHGYAEALILYVPGEEPAEEVHDASTEVIPKPVSDIAIEIPADVAAAPDVTAVLDSPTSEDSSAVSDLATSAAQDGEATANAAADDRTSAPRRGRPRKEV